MTGPHNPKTTWPSRIEHRRPSSQIRAVEPELTPVDGRAIAMGETMREIFFRDGGVTEQALIGEGYTAAEIIEHGAEARRHAGLLLVTHGGAAGDGIEDVIGKAIAAIRHCPPMPANTHDREMLRVAWADYCIAVGAFRLDPWISQQERCLVRLGIFLGLLPFGPAERNRIVNAVAISMKRRAAT